MKLRAIQLFGYAAGDVGNNLAFSMGSMFLLLYYTDVAGIPAAAAGTIFLVVRIWDGLADLVAGRLVDKTSSRWGKFRPWLLWGSVPMLLLNVAAFAVPEWGLTGKVLYASVTYAAVGTAYSLVNIPYGSLAAAMTQDPVERSKLASARSMGSAVTILLLSLVMSPQVKNSGDLQQDLLVTTMSLVVVGGAMYLFAFRTSREVVPREARRIGLRESLVTLRRNRPLVLLCASSLMFLIAMFSLQTIGIYYARDVLGDATYYVAITAAQMGCMFLLAPAVPGIVRRFGKKQGYIGSGIVMTAGSFGAMFAPATLPWLALGSFVVIGAGLGLMNTLTWSLEADTVEYGEWATGVRMEGATYAVFSFVRKLGQALGGSAAAYTIGLSGYVGGAAQQSGSAEWGIRAAAGIVPAGCVLVAIAIMLVYPLTERRFREITEQVRLRRGEEQDASSSAVAES